MILTDDLLLRMLAHTLRHVHEHDLLNAITASHPRCTTTRDPDTWHRPHAPTLTHRHRPALTICRRCDAATPCGLLALQRRDPHGVWGAMTATHRRRILQQLARLTGQPPRRQAAVRARKQRAA